MDEAEESEVQACRSCLLFSNNTYPILTTILQDNVRVLTMLNYFFLEIKEDDDLPKNICDTCLVKLQTAYDFIETYKKSQQLLHQQSEKQEPTAVLNDFKLSSGFGGVLEESNEKVYLNPASNDNQTEESIIIEYQDGDNDDSDEEDYLIEQSVKNTAVYEQHKFDGTDESEDSDAISKSEAVNKNETLTSDSSDSNSKWDAYRCPVCCKVYIEFHLLQEHLMQHEGEVTCRMCSLNFSSSALYWKHYQSKHRITCELCDKYFISKRNLAVHMKRHTNGVPLFTCSDENCSRTFRSKQSMKSHYLTCHSENRNFLCSTCGESFKNTDNLRYHIQKHKGPSHVCTYCGRAFMASTHLRDHMWRHLGTKPYKCTKCEQTFLSKRKLNLHMETNCEE